MAAGALAFSVLASCGGIVDDSVKEVGTTEQEQTAAVADLKGLLEKAEVGRTQRRTTKTPGGPSTGDPPYDYSGTPEAEAWERDKKSIPVVPTRPGVRQVVESTETSEYLVEVDDLAVRELAKEFKRRGLNRASRDGDGASDSESELQADEPGMRLMGWSNHTDNRVAKSPPTYSLTHAALRRQGALEGCSAQSMNCGDGCCGVEENPSNCRTDCPRYQSSGRLHCSAVRVGRRLVLTAAHCVVASNGSLNHPAYIPRRDGTTEPWGRLYFTNGWTDAMYIANNCHLTYNGDSCLEWDWALMLLPSSAWPTGPGWMGYWWDEDDVFETFKVRLDGYPRCHWADLNEPASCLDQVAYGYAGSAQGSVNSLTWRNFKHSRDMSSGQSGAPMYSYSPDIGGPYVIGLNVFEDCVTCTLDPTYGADPSYDPDVDDAGFPNRAVRIDEWLAGFIAQQRVAYP